MQMEELQQDIINDLEELSDALSQYSFLIQCAGECRAFPKAFRTEDALVRDCQVNTWMHLSWENGTCRLDADSESLIVKGALALFQELYDGRTRAEIAAFHCRLPEAECFSQHFNWDQMKGLRAMIRRIEGEAAENGCAQ